MPGERQASARWAESLAVSGPEGRPLWGPRPAPALAERSSRRGRGRDEAEAAWGDAGSFFTLMLEVPGRVLRCVSLLSAR